MNDVSQVPALAQAYRGAPQVFDEMVGADGQLRPHWRALLAQLGALDAAQLERRAENARQLIHQNGVSYDVYGESPGLARPWTLSIVPALMGPDDFRELALGVSQRARLLRLLVADLYGPQRVLTERVLPAELVFTHPWFLPPVHRIRIENWLPLYGVGVVRAPDGRFFAIDDRTEKPSGKGYALENRVVTSSVLPEMFRELNVERLGGFFRAFKETLAQAAPHNRDNPRIVLLTAGANDPTYFEQAYLAQFLGVTLVSGGDLTVRDERVYLKTLGGLLPIDVILRRVSDDACDPLELRADSMLGVPGLVQAVRSGNVAVMNPIGAGVVQTPALAAYLPALAQRLLGEELRLASPASYWCGDPNMLREVEARFDRIVIKHAFPGSNIAPVRTEELTAEARAELLAKIRATPARYAAQDPVAPSITPALENGALAPQSLALRCFAVSRGPSEYYVMPGGLARAGEGADVSMRLGGGVKDLWVISADAATGVSVVPQAQRAVELSRGGGDLPSRAADDLYWLGRYAERAEAVARLCRVVSARLVDLRDQAELDRSTEIAPLLAALTAQTQFNYTADIPRPSALALDACEKELVAAVCDLGCAGSLTSVVKSTLRAGRHVRDRISNDTWRVLTILDDDLRAIGTTEGPDRLSTMVNGLHRVVMTLAAFSGLAVESMTRGHAWRFLDMGRRIERAIALVTLIRATLVPGTDREAPLLESVLAIADSMMTYRRRYLASLQVAPVVDLLLADDSNPRSVIFQVRALAEHIGALPPLPGAGVRSPQHRLALAARSELELADVEALCALKDGARPELDSLSRHLGSLLPALSESLSNSYLNHATVSRHLRQDGS